MSAREGIIKTIIEEYIGFRQRAKGPCVISLPGLKCIKITPCSDQSQVTFCQKEVNSIQAEPPGTILFIASSVLCGIGSLKFSYDIIY
jgi:hypothetical protein